MKAAIYIGVFYAIFCLGSAAPLALSLVASSAGSGPATTGTVQNSFNQTIELPDPGQFKCESFQVNFPFAFSLLSAACSLGLKRSAKS